MTLLTTTIPYGFCHCGCGKKTNIAPCSVAKRGHKIGKPYLWLAGHKSKLPRVYEPDPAVPFKLDGEYCRLIPLSQSQYAIVWEIDYYELARWKWFAHWEIKTRTFYACRSAVDADGHKNTIWMHRQILGLITFDGKIGDHRNRKETLDNRRSNLRIATPEESIRNTGTRVTNKVRVKGCSFNNGSYMVRVGRKYIGRTRSLEIAAKMAEEAFKKYHGEFACLV